MDDPTLKRFVIAVLGDQHGINAAAYRVLLELVAEVEISLDIYSDILLNELRGILAKVKSVEGGLPEDWNE